MYIPRFLANKLIKGILWGNVFLEVQNKNFKISKFYIKNMTKNGKWNKERGKAKERKKEMQGKPSL